MILIVRKPSCQRVTRNDSKQEQANLFERYQRLAFKVAKKFADQFKRPYHEMTDEALTGLAMELASRWEVFDPSESQEQTWLYQAVYWHLKTHCLQMGKRKEISLDTEQDSHRAKKSWVESLIEEVGEEGRALLRAILDAPKELAAELTPRAPVSSRKKILAHLRDMEWSDEKIEEAWLQVESCIPN